MQLDPAVRPRQPRLNQFCVMVSGIIQKDMDRPHARIQRFDRHQHHDGTQGIHRQDIFHNGPASLQVDGAMDIQTLPATALFNRDSHILRPPAANRSRRVGRVRRIHKKHDFIVG